MTVTRRLLTVADGTEVGPASMIVGNLVAGKRIAQACGRDVAQLEDNEQASRAPCDITSKLTVFNCDSFAVCAVKQCL